jgi:hypothetical protein
VSFDGRDLRIGMDVFSADGVYLGSVVRIRWDRSVSTAVAAEADPTAGLPFSGERLGPMPTTALGNSGPASQSTATAYGSRRSRIATPDRGRPTELLIFRWLVSLTWSTARPRLRRIPVELIQLVALERIVLSVNADELR